MTIWSATQTFRLNEQIKESAEKLLFAMSDTQCSMRKYTHAHNTIERRQSDQRIEMNQWCAREVDTRLCQASPRTTEAHTCISWYSLNFRTHFYSNYGCSKFIACSINCSAKKTNVSITFELFVVTKLWKTVFCPSSGYIPEENWNEKYREKFQQ